MATQQKRIEVFWISGSPYAWRVLLTLEFKRLEYDSTLLEASKGDLKKPEYLALNPRGKVPVLKDGDFVLYESLAIMAYLDRQYPEPALFGRNPRETGTIWRAISEYPAYLHGPLDRIVRPVFFGKTAEKVDDIRAAVPEVHAELARLEASVGNAPWLSGEAISATDIALYPFIKALLRAAAKEAATPFALGLLPFAARYPRLAAWMQRVEAIPGYDRTYPPHWKT